MNELHRNGREPGDKRDVLLAVVAAGLFGVVYNEAVSRLNRSGQSEGFTSLLVVAGSGVLLLLAWPLLGVRAFGHLLALFTAGGTPMILGSLYRYAQAREAARQWIRSTQGVGTHGNEGERMAYPRERGAGPG